MKRKFAHVLLRLSEVSGGVQVVVACNVHDDLSKGTRFLRRPIIVLVLGKLFGGLHEMVSDVRQAVSPSKCSSGSLSRRFGSRRLLLRLSESARDCHESQNATPGRIHKDLHDLPPLRLSILQPGVWSRVKLSLANSP